MSSRRTLNRLPKVRREDLKPGESICDHCTGKCCRYFSLPLPRTPRSWDDYEEIRWYLAHGQTLIYVEKGTWYLVVMTRCQYLTAENRCAVYHDRPKICREYSDQSCEYDDDWIFEKVFETPEQIWEYARAILPPRRHAVTPSPSPGTLVQLVRMPGSFDPQGM